jgi:hypothetical protein
MTTKLLALLLTLLVVGQSQVFAAGAPLELRWDELNSTIYGHTVELTLPGAITVSGNVAAIREDGLVLDVKKTTDRKAFPKGNAMIPRASVTLLSLEQHGGSHWRTIGTVIGVLSGVALGGYTAAKTANSPGSGVAIFLGTASAISVAGFYAGHVADKTTTEIRVVR